MNGIVKRWRHKRFVGLRESERVPVIDFALRTAPPGYVALLGDSHAEFLDTPDFGGRAVVNLGIGGSTASDCARRLAGLEPLTEAVAAVLFVGTNDALRWFRPGSSQAYARFDNDVDAILRAVAGWCARAFVAAVPPVGPQAKGRDPAVTVDLSGRLREACARHGATFVDPFAAMRGPVPGLAYAGLHPDGVHMADYARLASEISRFVDLGLMLPPTDGRTATSFIPGMERISAASAG